MLYEIALLRHVHELTTRCVLHTYVMHGSEIVVFLVIWLSPDHQSQHCKIISQATIIYAFHIHFKGQLSLQPIYSVFLKTGPPQMHPSCEFL